MTDVPTDAAAFAVVYSTFPDEASARAAAQAVVAARLAACVAMLPGMVSVYRWQGVIEEAREVVLLAKTRRDLAAAVHETIAAHHPYAVPALLTLSVEAASRAYGAWILAETGPAGPGLPPVAS